MSDPLADGPPFPTAPTETGADPDAGDPAVLAAIAAEIAERGRITFARFMELALYHPTGGYYLAPERRPGRGGDFITAPETHPFFGMALARQIAECWQRLDRPDPFTVREEGAGVGGLAYDIIAGLSVDAPDLLPALRYRLVETNPHRREQAAAAMAEVGLAAIVSVEPPPGDGARNPIVGVALANEVADALPVHRLVRRDGTWRERWVTTGPDGFAETEADLSPPARGFDPEARLAAAGVESKEGDAIEISPAAAAWFAAVGRGIERGYALVIDYGYPTGELYRAHRLAGTLRAYHRHTVDDQPFRRVGRQDLTAHVDFGALVSAGRSVGLDAAGATSQGEFLAGVGLGELLVRLQADPATTAAEYRAAQAAVFRLIDPGGMGRFGVLMMARAAPVAPPLLGFRPRGPLF